MMVQSLLSIQGVGNENARRDTYFIIRVLYCTIIIFSCTPACIYVFYKTN